MSECRNCGYTMQVDELETEITHLKKLLKEAVPWVEGCTALSKTELVGMQKWLEEVGELK